MQRWGVRVCRGGDKGVQRWRIRVRAEVFRRYGKSNAKHEECVSHGNRLPLMQIELQEI